MKPANNECIFGTIAKYSLIIYICKKKISLAKKLSKIYMVLRKKRIYLFFQAYDAPIERGKFLSIVKKDREAEFGVYT